MVSVPLLARLRAQKTPLGICAKGMGGFPAAKPCDVVVYVKRLWRAHLPDRR